MSDSGKWADELLQCNNDCPPNSDVQFHTLTCSWRLRPPVVAAPAEKDGDNEFDRVATERDKLRAEIEKLKAEIAKWDKIWRVGEVERRGLLAVGQTLIDKDAEIGKLRAELKAAQAKERDR